MRKLFYLLVGTIVIASCNSKTSPESKLEGFNVSEDDKKDLEAAEKKMFDEIIKFGDYWKTDVADDYVTINADGAMQTKAESLADTAHRKIFVGVSSTKLSDRKVRKYGDIAIINGKAEFMVADKMAAEIFYTEIWLKKDGKWMFNGWQGTITKEMQQAMMSNMPKPE
jgi:hypothetical protein